jgi:hypothetical protein
VKLIKMLGLAISLAIAAMAFTGASSALADVQIDTCHEKLAKCSISSVGTLLLGLSANVQLHNSFLTNTCHSNVTAKVVQPLAIGAQEGDVEVTAIDFLNCSSFPAHPNAATLPWLLTTTEALFKASLTGLVTNSPGKAGVLVSLLSIPIVGTCNYLETSSDMPKWKYIPHDATHNARLEITGSLERQPSSPSICGLGNILGTYELIGVDDPNLTAAKHIQILE